MWTMIPSLDRLVQDLAPVFTEPTFHTHCQLLLGWLMCLSTRNPYRVCQAIHADQEIPRSQRHPFDRFYNFFSRSAWTAADLAYHVAVLVVTHLNPTGWLYLIVDDTLLHKRGKKVWGLGWFRDAAASTRAIPRSTTAMARSALRSRPTLLASRKLLAMTAGIVYPGVRSDAWMLGLFPTNRATAMVSPSARPSPSITAPTMPLRAYGSTAIRIVS